MYNNLHCTVVVVRIITVFTMSMHSHWCFERQTHYHQTERHTAVDMHWKKIYYQFFTQELTQLVILAIIQAKLLRIPTNCLLQSCILDNKTPIANNSHNSNWNTLANKQWSEHQAQRKKMVLFNDRASTDQLVEVA